ncbi:16S rRNA (guanine(527)-N(7))-methyltransferase RsmG [Aliiroseovarius sp. S1339]|uniref:16S rRNA (guanine(527)-N(7))-methyltransferase RsmG n=1 Tax=Aliiroseovarius sp. S1339 TaxID=2936990 RepID=UPI0020C0006F|nr:16S rRNA (guanine(527)-N(7))-methyltransferase RsmG [Aliiroseovarius sp. S1339]MCK8463281.1 16S rRNA (guanine(527)-N(7))-methyltransferase RsmG [Aliiroseovarius sp. S1339]
MTGKELLADYDVSRETIEKLGVYAALLQKWNPAINLVAPSTLATLWSRHFLDSAQIIDLTPESMKTWCDMGTGGGFPGLIVAIMAQDRDPKRQTVCIESDIRKATFLRTVVREADVNATILSERIEAVTPQNADVVSARALAPLKDLLGYADRHLAPAGMGIFLKGENYRSEVEEALEVWRFQLDTYPSKTHPDAVVLKIGDLNRA